MKVVVLLLFSLVIIVADPFDSDSHIEIDDVSKEFPEDGDDDDEEEEEECVNEEIQEPPPTSRPAVLPRPTVHPKIGVREASYMYTHIKHKDT